MLKMIEPNAPSQAAVSTPVDLSTDRETLKVNEPDRTNFSQ